MIENRVYIYAERRIAERCIAIYLRRAQVSGEFLCGEITWKPLDVATFSAHPAAETIDDTAAQVLMDHLWEAGVRPSEGNGSAGAMAAAQKNLEDLRRVVEFLQGQLARGPSPLEMLSSQMSIASKLTEATLRQAAMAATTSVVFKEPTRA